jgi:hypothetical protein
MSAGKENGRKVLHHQTLPPQPSIAQKCKHMQYRTVPGRKCPRNRGKVSAPAGAAVASDNSVRARLTAFRNVTATDNALQNGGHFPPEMMGFRDQTPKVA